MISYHADYLHPLISDGTYSGAAEGVHIWGGRGKTDNYIHTNA